MLLHDTAQDSVRLDNCCLDDPAGLDVNTVAFMCILHAASRCVDSISPRLHHLKPHVLFVQAANLQCTFRLYVN